MKGIFEYIDKDNNLQRVNNSDDIPSDTKELVMMRYTTPEHPHTDEEHAYIERTHEDFHRIKFMVYGGANNVR